MHNYRFVVLATLVSSLGCAELPTSLEDGGAGSGASDNVGAGNVEGGGGAGQGADGSGATGQGGELTQPASFELSVDDAAPSIELRDSVELTITIAENGYVGPVALMVSGLPDDVTGQLASPTVTLDGAGTTDATLRLSSLSSTVTGEFPFMVSAAVETGAKSAGATITIEPVITITIPADLAGFSSDPPNTTAFGDYPTMIKALPIMDGENTITVRFFNADTVAHEIHADNTNEGFGHGIGPIPPMSFDPAVRQINTPGVYDFYPHDDGIGVSVLGQISIMGE